MITDPHDSNNANLTKRLNIDYGLNMAPCNSGMK